MRSVWKFLFNAEGECAFTATDNFEVVHVGLCPQTNNPAMWVDDTRDPLYLQPRTFRLYGTGHEIPRHAVHVGSLIDDAMVWHVYKVQG